jgi:hypothetical protein
MSSVELTKEADADGTVHIDLPTGTPHASVHLHVTYEVGERRRARTKEEYRTFIDSVFGKCDDPTFVAPADQEMPHVEPL